MMDRLVFQLLIDPQTINDPQSPSMRDHMPPMLMPNLHCLMARL